LRLVTNLPNNKLSVVKELVTSFIAYSCGNSSGF
jgi:hypothetical protein